MPAILESMNPKDSFTVVWLTVGVPYVLKYSFNAQGQMDIMEIMIAEKSLV